MSRMHGCPTLRSLDRASPRNCLSLAIVIEMSQLLPNLDALLKELSGDTESIRDARALAVSVGSATTWSEADKALDSTISSWLLP